MQTQTKVVISAFLNCEFTSEIVSRRDSILRRISSRDWPPGRRLLLLPPRAPIIVLSMGPNWVDSWESLARAFSSTVGNWRKRRVWPVGAVSKIIVSYERDLTCLSTSAKDMASSTPGICIGF